MGWKKMETKKEAAMTHNEVNNLAWDAMKAIQEHRNTIADATRSVHHADIHSDMKELARILSRASEAIADMLPDDFVLTMTEYTWPEAINSQA